MLIDCRSLDIEWGDCAVSSGGFFGGEIRIWLSQPKANGPHGGGFSASSGDKYDRVKSTEWGTANGYIFSTASDEYTAQMQTPEDLGIVGQIIGVQPFIGEYDLGGATMDSVASLVLGSTISAMWMVLEGHQTWRDAGAATAELLLRALHRPRHRGRNLQAAAFDLDLRHGADVGDGDR